jgi:DNA-directed RNA polymerase subunit RPC12/RpoP
MFKCFDCGHLFDRGEERRVVEMHGEEYLACPSCGGAYEETVQCKSCGGHFFEDDLYNGLCEMCIGEKMTLKNMMQYLEDSCLEQDFYLEEYYKSSVNHASEELIKVARDGFMWKLNLDKLNHYGVPGFESELVGMMRAFIVDDHFGLFDYAEWINKKEGRSNG